MTWHDITSHNITSNVAPHATSLQGWTEPMLKAVMENLIAARNDPECKVIIFTGAGKYYCAGVNLAGVLKIMVRQSPPHLTCTLFLSFSCVLASSLHCNIMHGHLFSHILASFPIRLPAKF